MHYFLNELRNFEPRKTTSECARANFEENFFAQIKNPMKRNKPKKKAPEGTDGHSKSTAGNLNFENAEQTAQMDVAKSLTHWCQSEGNLQRDKVKGKTRFHQIRTVPERCECNNYYCQCGPNPALEAIEDERQKADKVETKISKATNASVLREAAILLKENQKQQDKILELLSASKNYLDYEKYLHELRETQEKEALVELEKKHLSGQLSYEEAILAKQRVIEENAKRREEYLEEKATLEEELQEFRDKEMAKVKEMVRDVQEQHAKAKEKQAKTVREKRKAAQVMAHDLKERLRQSIRQQEQEIERKIAAIREFKILQQIKKEELNSRDEKMTKLVSVSMEELKARLALYKRKMRDELMKKRKKIQKYKCRQEMIKTAASR